MIAVKYQANKYHWIILMVLLIALNSCSSGPQIYNSNSSVSPELPVTQKQVGTAILSASRFFEQWTIQKLRSGEMQGVLSYGSHRATVSIPYDAHHFNIIYQSSNNFDYDQEDKTIHPRYNDWVKKLEHRIHEEIQYHLQLLK